MQKETVTVFFDGKCKICTNLKIVTQKLDAENSIKFVNLWRAQNAGGCEKRELAQEIHLITSGGEIFKGYFAIKYILIRLPILKLFRFFLKHSLVDSAGVYIYKIVSRNRTRLWECGNCAL